MQHISETRPHPRYDHIVVSLDGTNWEIVNRVLQAMKKHQVTPSWRDTFVMDALSSDDVKATCRRWVVEDEEVEGHEFLGFK